MRYAELCQPAAGGVPPVHFAGIGHRCGLRSASSFPPPSAPDRLGAGLRILPVCGGGTVFVLPEPNAGATAHLYALGRMRRSGSVLLPVLRPPAADLGLLGRHFGVFAAFAANSVDLVEKILQKKWPISEKYLSFYEKMLYNKENCLSAL